MARKHSSLNLFAALQAELACRLLWIARKHYSHYHTVAFRLDSCHLKHQHVLNGREKHLRSISLAKKAIPRRVGTITAEMLKHLLQRLLFLCCNKLAGRIMQIEEEINAANIINRERVRELLRSVSFVRKIPD